LLLCASIAVAKEVKIRKAWVRTFPNTSLEIFPDNLGHIAALGSNTNGSFALLLNEKGRTVARASIPIPGVAGAVADSAGRIFLTGAVFPLVTVHCAAFASSLSSLLWIHTNNIGYLYPPPGFSTTLGPSAPDEAGGVFVFGDWQAGMFMSHFHSAGSDVNGIYVGLLTPYRTAGAIARTPNGDTFFVGNAVAFRNQWITVIKWNPAISAYAVHGLNSPGVNGDALANAATSDSQGNLIIVGSHFERALGSSRLGRSSTMKLDSNGNLVWEVFQGPYGNATYGPGEAGLAVAVDKSDNIIMTGTAGTVKYSPAGQVLWESPEYGNTLHLDRFGNVLISKQVVRDDGIYEAEIIKFNANGTPRWRTRFHDRSPYDNWPTGLVMNKAGNIYLCTQNGDQSTIVKFVELAAARQR